MCSEATVHGSSSRSEGHCQRHWCGFHSGSDLLLHQLGFQMCPWKVRPLSLPWAIRTVSGRRSARHWMPLAKGPPEQDSHSRGQGEVNVQPGIISPRAWEKPLLCLWWIANCIPTWNKTGAPCLLQGRALRFTWAKWLQAPLAPVPLPLPSRVTLWIIDFQGRMEQHRNSSQISQ